MSLPLPVVIVARNNLGLTKKTVASVLKQDVPVEILLVDNQSTDGTAAWCASKSFCRVHTGEQWSLAKCWNTALRLLWKAGHGSALVLNNDVEIRPDTARLLATHGGPFVTCVSVDSADRMGVPGDRDIDTLRKGERPRPDFSAFLIRKTVTDFGIWFNEECWPAFYEDNFFHKAMHDAGIPALCLDLPFHHLGSATVKNASQRDRRIIQEGAQRNKELFRSRYGCIPGDCEKYDALFSEATFGMNKTVARLA